MGLHGQVSERGYSMAALLVAIAIMSILMSVAMPVWRTQARREREAELVFRGEQYARAIAMYRERFGGALPASIDVLVQGKFLRKKYQDPITAGEFQILAANTAPQQTGAQIAGGIMGVRSKSQETSLRSYKGQSRYDQWPFTFNLVTTRRGGNVQGGEAGRGARGGRAGEGRGAPGSPGRAGPGQPGRGINPGIGFPQAPPPPPPPGRGRGPGGRGPGDR